MKKAKPKVEKKIKKEFERANAEIETPKNVDYIEVPMSNEELEKVGQKYSALIDQTADFDLRKRIVNRQKKLLFKIFKAATLVLTDKQYQVFVMKYVYGFKNREIAEKLGRYYSSKVIKSCVKKIQGKLRIEENLTFLTGNYANEE